VYSTWVALPCLVIARIAAAGARGTGLFEEGSAGPGLLEGSVAGPVPTRPAAAAAAAAEDSLAPLVRCKLSSSPGASPATLRPRATSPASAKTAKKRTGAAGDRAE
jgi:hypothetical protein